MEEICGTVVALKGSVCSAAPLCRWPACIIQQLIMSRTLYTAAHHTSPIPRHQHRRHQALASSYSSSHRQCVPILLLLKTTNDIFRLTSITVTFWFTILMYLVFNWFNQKIVKIFIAIFIDFVSLIICGLWISSFQKIKVTVFSKRISEGKPKNGCRRVLIRCSW